MNLRTFRLTQTTYRTSAHTLRRLSAWLCCTLLAKRGTIYLSIYLD